MATTLNTGVLLIDIIDAFRERFPLLFRLGTDFSSDRARYNEQIIAQIASVPAVQDYDSSNGYKANAASATSLVTDVPITLNRHKHVPVKVDYIDQISTRRNLYNETVSHLAYALGKEAMDYVLSQVVAANFSKSSIFSEANSDKDMLDTMCKNLNAEGASPLGRFGVVNSEVYSTLEADSRVSSGDYHGQKREGNAYGVLRNIAGFEEVFEYPSLPTNSEFMTGFFADKSSIAIASRLPVDVDNLAKSLGLPQIAKVDEITDKETGLSLLGLTWQEAGTFDIYTTVTWLYGIAAGKQGGASDALTDKGLRRLVTQ